MAGIYIHIPFCSKACNYCNFHFSTSLANKESMVKAIAIEIELSQNADQKRDKAERNTLQEKPIIETIYFGGGTPSLLTSDELKILLDTIYKTFNVSSNAEITLETNPDDHTQEKLEAWKLAGINRLSIGVQSFYESDLVWMNRAHSAEQSINCIKAAQDKGFHNLTIDLIYGIPGLTDERWKHNFDTAIDLQIPHLSCYALTVEPKTALDNMIKKKAVINVDTDQQANQFLLLMDWAKAAGFEHYEISNFAKPGQRSRHNSNYWSGVPYYGFGPSAHSFDGNKTRWWNVANNALYLKAIENNLPCFEAEVLTPVQQQNEYIMTALRTKEGIERIKHKAFETLVIKANKWIQQGKVLADEHHLWLTNEGKLFADGIAGDLFADA